MDRHNEPAATSAVRDGTGITWVNRANEFPDRSGVHWFPQRIEVQTLRPFGIDTGIGPAVTPPEPSTWAGLWERPGPLTPAGLAYETGLQHLPMPDAP